MNKTIKVSDETYRLIKIEVAKTTLKNPDKKIYPDTIINNLLKQQG